MHTFLIQYVFTNVRKYSCRFLLFLGILDIIVKASIAPPPHPHIIFVLQDDLGHHDVGFTNKEMLPVTGNVSTLAEDGIILTNHLVHYHCSPTRRSLLTGRLPIHHGEMLSGVTTDDIDLRWTLFPKKLKQAGYITHWIGKGHTGYKSMAHLPTSQGFDSFFGFLSGSQSYYSSDRWRNEGPLNDTTYSSILYGKEAVKIVREHPTNVSLFLYLPWQAVHSPYDPVPNFNCSTDKYPPYPGTYAGMLYESDLYVGQLVAVLKEKNMWEHTLIVYSSDNGGVSENGLAGINYPLRGEKHGNWAGGYRVAAFIAGGMVPKKLQGTTNNLRIHVVDWYITFCMLAGMSAKECADDPPVPPLPVDPSDPTKDIYGNFSYPGVDGVNVWPFLISDNIEQDDYAAHPTLVISAQVILKREYKLLIGQGSVPDSGKKTRQKDGWHLANGTWITAKQVGWKCGLSFGKNATYIPCLFNESSDLREQQDLAPDNAKQVAAMWAELNYTLLTSFLSRSPKALFGPCNHKCAQKHWKSVGGSGNGPICGVPGCT